MRTTKFGIGLAAGLMIALAPLAAGLPTTSLPKDVQRACLVFDINCGSAEVWGETEYCQNNNPNILQCRVALHGRANAYGWILPGSFVAQLSSGGFCGDSETGVWTYGGASKALYCWGTVSVPYNQCVTVWMTLTVAYSPGGPSPVSDTHPYGVCYP